MPGDYEYDVFVSYRHRDPVFGWVKNHFFPLLEQWLPECLPVDHNLRIFIDFQLETGQNWPNALKRALKHSRCLLPILSPEYFRSSWCRSEWESMLDRERRLGFRTPENPSALIYPVRFFDGQHFPREAIDMQWKDLSDWNFPVPSFAQTQAYLDFITAVKDAANDIAMLISAAPPWQNDWPTIDEHQLQPVGMRLPRIR